MVAVHSICQIVRFKPHQLPGLRIADDSIAVVSELNLMNDVLALGLKIVTAHAQDIGERYLPDPIHFDRYSAFGCDPRAIRGLGDGDRLIATDFGHRLSSQHHDADKAVAAADCGGVNRALVACLTGQSCPATCQLMQGISLRSPRQQPGRERV